MTNGGLLPSQAAGPAPRTHTSINLSSITSDHNDTFPQQWQSSPSLSLDPMSWHGLGSLRLSHSLLQFLQLLYTNAFFFSLQPCPVFESWHDEKTTCYLWSLKHDSSLLWLGLSTLPVLVSPSPWRLSASLKPPTERIQIHPPSTHPHQNL